MRADNLPRSAGRQVVSGDHYSRLAAIRQVQPTQSRRRDVGAGRWIYDERWELELEPQSGA